MWQDARQALWDDPRPPRPDPEELLHAAVAAWGVESPRYATLLDALVEVGQPALTAADGLLDAAVERLWGQGWTPADLVHVVGRRLTARHAELTAARVVADGERRAEREQPLHPRWRQQLASLEEETFALDGSRPQERLRRIVDVLGLVARLPSVPRTVPPPGEAWESSSAHEGHLDARMLSRVRALLAKAESTVYEQEAEAFTAKAQELIARHAIDEALLHTVEDVGDPSVRRIMIDDPYADAKAYLIAEVAGANRCRVVHSSDLGWVTAFGYDHDLDAVELLSTSLLAQATGAMIRQGPRRDAAGRSRTRSFRRAFLLGFAQRIGERLRRATDEQMSSSDDDRLLPVLAVREDRLLAAQERAFPDLVRRTTSASNPTGWSAGRAAAERADLGAAPRRPLTS